ncbi:RHS repeat-associated core domain-containing protein [Aestuariibacter sp. AA17]|uniref:RHS repeat-associated core domain-containing protein n=1 Tax=Fluctibacter corallii TaxID=2984329 RepID=A0ABT3ACT5_9ALTE|nr:RHS repeat-associated core domain-containing protein [Aestuariibacter sp. AA17]
MGYTGHKFDTDLGLSYMQARYYDPVIGRFYSNDPIGFRDVHSFNRYAYANNNPYKYVDPDGKAPNQAGVATIQSLRDEVAKYEAAGLNGAQAMAALSANRAGNSNRYLFTDNFGWVDLRHFGAAAELSYGVGSVTAEIMGLGVEIVQYLNESEGDYRSAFSQEDLPSNAAGAMFGDDYLSGAKGISSSLNSFLDDVGARDPSDPVAGTANLPATDAGGASNGFSGVFRVAGRIESRKLDEQN